MQDRLWRGLRFYLSTHFFPLQQFLFIFLINGYGKSPDNLIVTVLTQVKLVALRVFFGKISPALLSFAHSDGVFRGSLVEVFS